MSEHVPTGNPYDIDGQHFNPDMYMQKLLKEFPLKQIMDKENEIVRETQALHSDMQTLVYENYNKFIAGTDTIRKMKNDFKKMEDEMDLLAKNMESITSFSDQISSTLQDTRQKITKLSGVHSLLKRLQFLFKLPGNLKERIQEGQYTQAVQDYMHAQRVLRRYSDMPSFQGIQQDCEAIVAELKARLYRQFQGEEATPAELAQAVDLLLQLREPAPELCSRFLLHADGRLAGQLSLLGAAEDQDIMEFVDRGSNGFLSDLCLVVASYTDMFVNRPRDGDSEESDEAASAAVSQLGPFVLANMERYLELVQARVDGEPEGGDTAVLVRALDRFHRRLQAMSTLFSDADFARTGTEVVLRAGRRQCRGRLQALKLHFAGTLARARQALAAPRPPATQAGREGDGSGGGQLLPELLASLVLSTVEKVKGVLQDLLLFAQPDLTFGLKPHFRERFCVEHVREELVVGFLHHLTATARGFCGAGDSKVPPILLLLLSKVCLELQASSVQYLLRQTDEWFGIEDQHGTGVLTGEEEICAGMRAAAQELLNCYVRTQGLGVSQMLRKSVETRDWLHSIEPRTVRAVMKRVVEDVAALDGQVGALYEEGQRTEHSSDSSRRTHSVSASRHAYRSNWSSYTPNQLNASLATNIQRLFSERIEIFSAVDFSKVSILTGIIKISLKTFLECVRLRTFSRYGLQQIQVDTHYLQLYLWRFVEDENLVHFLLDEILGSAVHRCLDPVLMEPGVVEIICERG
ncbi:vacuolar protein sorting-associated protein 51 homolog [Bacillus rossius redtenbacheri]|uniref:vacuolar protein sorting-associated protein 51 homolog n=1 Tax=Bacillus rossius redtenbacheri TaxID=93214 RepID=UPI002FDCC6E4